MEYIQHPTVLKELAAELSIPLLKIFQSCIDSGKIPDTWKIAHITPVFKKGDKCDPSNYRPMNQLNLYCQQDSGKSYTRQSDTPSSFKRVIK